MSLQIPASPSDRRLILLGVAQRIHEEVIEVEHALRGNLEQLALRGWHLGKALVALKEEVTHGNWLFWLGQNWDEMGERRTQQYMALYKANEHLSNPQCIADLDVNSLRAFQGKYMPAKVRPKLPGDRPLVPAVSFDSGANRFAQMFQRIDQGHATKPPWPVVAPQAKLLIEGFRKLYPEEFEELLG